MTTFNIDAKKSYTQIKQACFKDTAVSLSARGLFLAICYRPGEWDCSLDTLRGRVKDTPEKINSSLAELQNAGYLFKTETPGDTRYSIREKA